MSLDLQTLNNADVNYIAKHNSNYAAIKAAVESLDATLGGALGATLSTLEAFSALFGPSVAVVGKGSCLCHGSGSTLTVDQGWVWFPASGLIVEHTGSSTLSFTGLSAATYYIVVDETGSPSRTTTSTDAIYSVVWTGAAFGTITRLANLVWAAADWTAAQTSTALAASYEGLDDRLEAGETISKANETAIGALGTASALDIDIDGTLAADSDLFLATQKAVKTYVDTEIAGAVGGITDAMQFKGSTDCSANPNYPAADAGNLYRVSVAGRIGGAAGPRVEAGDSYYCITDGTAAGNHATVGANWVIQQANIDGAVFATTPPTNHGVMLGKGTQEIGATAVMSNGQLLVGQTGADPLPKTMSGDATIDQNGALTITVKPLDAYSFYPGVPADSALMFKMIVGRAETIPDDFAGSYADAEVAATASTVFTVKKNGASVGTVTFAIGATTGTWVTTGATVALAAGDKVTIHAPATHDTTLADISFTIIGNRT